LIACGDRHTCEKLFKVPLMLGEQCFAIACLGYEFMGCVQCFDVGFANAARI